MKMSEKLKRQSNVLFVVAHLITTTMCLVAYEKLIDSDVVAVVVAIVVSVGIMTISGTSGVIWEQHKIAKKTEDNS
jgi:hypothetical protein